MYSCNINYYIPFYNYSCKHTSWVKILSYSSQSKGADQNRLLPVYVLKPVCYFRIVEVASVVQLLHLLQSADHVLNRFRCIELLSPATID